jgi:hypothetical protein
LKSSICNFDCQPLVDLIFLGLKIVITFKTLKLYVMRTAALVIFFVACGHAAIAQFSLLPQVGFENSKTIIRYNDANSFFPVGVTFSPQASLRLNYASKQGHGFFVGVASSRSVVSFMVPNAENGINNYTAEASNMQLRLEGGYQFSSPKISLGKSNAKQSSGRELSENRISYKNAYSNRCGRSYRYGRCGADKTKSENVLPAKSKASSWVRIQPSIGMGFIPSVKTDVIAQGASGYEYRAGNWNTALVTGANLEFGKDKTSLFTVSVNYFNAMGNLGKQTITTVQNGKSTTSLLQSDVSGWNLRVGIPFSLSKTQAAKAKKAETYKPERKSYRQHRVIYYRCRSL